MTNYSKENSSKIINSSICGGLDVYNSYKSQLKAYNKKLFDPFCRQHTTKTKFSYYYEEDKYITTTTGQLNFFKWAIDNRIINYVREHCLEIKKDLKAKQKKTTLSSISSNSPLSSTNLSDTKTITNYIICFD